MVKILIAIICFLPMLLNAQGFGSFAFDQPYLAKSRVLLGGVDLTNGCIAYWAMNELGNITRQDETAYNRDLTDQNGNFNGGAGIIYGAAYNPGILNAGLRSTDSAFGGGVTFTIAGWIYQETDAVDLEAMSAQWNSGSYGAWALYWGTGADAQFFLMDSGASFYTINAWGRNELKTTWVFVAFGYDSSDSKGWITTNTVSAGVTGALAGGLTNVATATVNFTVGNWGSGNQALYGKVDEMGYWNRRLTTNEIVTLYNGGAGLTYTNFNTVQNP